MILLYDFSNFWVLSLDKKDLIEPTLCKLNTSEYLTVSHYWSRKFS